MEGTANTTDNNQAAHRPGEQESGVIVVVGGKEFHENGGFLAFISGYFEAALRIGMKESNTKRFEFPDKDPEEWKIFIAAMKSPLSNVKLTVDNVELILRWCDELCVKVGETEVDQVFSDKFDRLDPFQSTYSSTSCAKRKKTESSQLPVIIDALETATHCGLTISAKSIAALLGSYLKKMPEEFGFADVSRLVSILKENVSCRADIWNSVALHIPQGLQSEGPETLLHNSFLPHIIWQNIEKIKEKTALKATLIEEANETLLEAVERLLQRDIYDYDAPISVCVECVREALADPENWK